MQMSSMGSLFTAKNGKPTRESHLKTGEDCMQNGPICYSLVSVGSLCPWHIQGVRKASGLRPRELGWGGFKMTEKSAPPATGLPWPGMPAK